MFQFEFSNLYSEDKLIFVGMPKFRFVLLEIRLSDTKVDFVSHIILFILFIIFFSFQKKIHKLHKIIKEDIFYNDLLTFVRLKNLISMI